VSGRGERLDLILLERDLARSRTEARGLIMAGRVKIDGRVVDKPGRRFDSEVRVEVDRPRLRSYASRGGVKLERALEVFGLRVTGLTCIDAGASTGGFTDCLLTHGAARVYAVDVGYGVLAWELRTDPRVVVLERTNARYLTRERFREVVSERGLEVVWPSFATFDLSFISLGKVVPVILGLLEPVWQAVLLVKPQFEAGPEKVGRRGVVRDPAVHVDVLERVIGEVAAPSAAGDGAVVGAGAGAGAGTGANAGPGAAVGAACAGSGASRPARAAGLTYSPVRGPEGNIEYLLWLRAAALGAAASETTAGLPDIEEVVREAFDTVPRT